MKSEIKRLWPRDEEGYIIWQNHPDFKNHNISNDDRLAMLRRDDEIARDTERLWREAGFEVIASYNEPYLISSIKLAFKPEVWLDLCHSEGEYLPMCCANISSIRDILIGTLREGQFITCSDLSECDYLAKSHEWELEEQTEEGEVNFEADDPIATLIRLWAKVEPFAYTRSNATKIDPEKIEDACKVVSSYPYQFVYRGLFSEHPEAVQARQIADIQTLRILIPSIRLLYHRIEELNPGEITGWAVCDDGQVAYARRGGLAVFASEQIANEVKERWSKEISKESPSNHSCQPKQYEVREIKMTLENGVEFIN